MTDLKMEVPGYGSYGQENKTPSKTPDDYLPNLKMASQRNKKFRFRKSGRRWRAEQSDPSCSP